MLSSTVFIIMYWFQFIFPEKLNKFAEAFAIVITQESTRFEHEPFFSLVLEGERAFEAVPYGCTIALHKWLQGLSICSSLNLCATKNLVLNPCIASILSKAYPKCIVACVHSNSNRSHCCHGSQKVRLTARSNAYDPCSSCTRA